MIENKKKYRLVKILKKFLPLIGLFLFAYIIYNTGPEKIISTFLKIPPVVFLLVAILIFIRSLINNLAWQIILKKQKIKISFFKTLKIQFIGFFYACISPGGVGKYINVLYLKDETHEPTGKLFVNVLIKSLVYMFAFYLILITAAFFISDKYPHIFFGILIYVLVSLLIIVYFIQKERGEKTFKLFIKYFIPKRLKDVSKNFTESFYLDFPRVRDLSSPFLISIITNIISYLQMYIIAVYLEIEVPFTVFMVIFSVASIISMIPISIGGLGTKEAALIFLFEPLGFATEKIIVFSIAGYIITILFVASIGMILAFFDARNKKVKLFRKFDLSNI